MKKLISVLLSLGLLLACLSACGGQITASNSPSSEQSSDVSQSTSDQMGSSDVTSNDTSSMKVTKTSSKISSKGTSSATSSPKVNYGLRRVAVRKGLLSYFNIQSRGYFDTTGAGITMDWSGATVEFYANCEKELELSFNSSSSSAVAYITILVDGKAIGEGGRSEILGSKSLIIAKGLARGLHKVKMIRQSDCEGPMLTFIGITMNGQIANPPANKGMYIEFIGDSSIIGWGNLLDDYFFKTHDVRVSDGQRMARDDSNQDGTKTYPAMVANTLNADFTIIAKQGAGVAVTYHSSPSAGCLNQIYLKSSFRGGAPSYDFRRKADFIVIDTGSLDDQIIKNPTNKDNLKKLEVAGITADQILPRNVEFLKNIVRAKNPTAKVIWCYGFSGTASESFIKQVVSEAGGSNAGFYTFKLPAATTERMAYPSVANHQKAASDLTNYIRNLMK